MNTQFFLQDLVRRRSLQSYFGFKNERFLFPKPVEHTVTFGLLTVVGTGCVTSEMEFCWNAWTVEEMNDPSRRITLTPNDIELLNPNTLTCPVFLSTRDAIITKAIYMRVPPVVRDKQPDSNAWGLRYLEMFHSAHDSDAFVERGNTLPAEDTYLEYYEAKQMSHFDHRWAVYEDGVTKECHHDNPLHIARGRYLVAYSRIAQKLASRWERRWRLAWRDVARGTDIRTFILAVIPEVVTSDKLPVAAIAQPDDGPAFVAQASSFIVDYIARQKFSGAGMKFHIVKQLAMLPPAKFHQACPWAKSGITVFLWLLSRVLELTYTAWDLEPFAQDCGYDGPPFRWDEERRFQLRAELDAAFFHLYLPSDAHGDWLPAANESPEDLDRLKESFPQPRDAVSYIMDTFPIVRRKDIAKHGTYRTKDTILEIYDAMQAAIRTGIPYQTPLNPPPGPPTDANGQFIPFAQWTSHLNTSHIHPPRESAAKKPQVLVVDPAFPGSDLKSQSLCACLLDFVNLQPGLVEEQYVDLVILAMQPANCRLLLTGDDRDRFDQSLKSVFPELIADSDGKPPWRLLLSTLQANQSIQSDRFAPGPNAQIVRGKLPDVDGQFVEMVLKAGERLLELQDAATPDTAPSTPPPMGVRSTRKVREDAPTDPALARLVNSIRHHRTAAMTGAT